MAERGVAHIVDGAAATCVVRAVGEALGTAGHAGLGVDVAGVFDVDGDLVVGRAVGLFDDVDFALVGPVGGGGGEPEGGPGAAC